MPKTRQCITFSRAGESIDSLPRCSGIYRFFDAEGLLLYIGKSVDIHCRVAQHVNEGRKTGRYQRFMSRVTHIDCQLTAGEIGALLIENAAIKSEVPLFNRRQRQLRRLWTIQLQPTKAGFLQPTAIDFAPTGARDSDTYGLFPNKHRITTSVQNLARDHALCLRVMGFDKGKGACFQHQLGRCDGACAGQESAESHNARLLDQLDQKKITAWPFAGPLLLQEFNIHPIEHQPAKQFHLVDQWAWHGCFDSLDDVKKSVNSTEAIGFDRDAYRLIFSAIYHGRVALQDALTQRPLVNPLLADRQAAW